MGRRLVEAKSETATCAALFAAAALARILFLAGTIDRGLPFSVYYYGDSRIFREFAFALMRGGVFEQGLPLHPPGFAFVLSWVIGIIGERPTMMRALLAVIAAAAVPLTYVLGRLIWSRGVGLVAAVLSMFSFGLCVVSVSATPETIYIPLLLVQALLVVLLGDALVRDRRRSVPILVMALGVTLGLGALIRAEHLGMVIMIPAALALGWPTIPRRRIALVTGLIAALGVAVTAPWAIRNHAALERFNAMNPGLTEPLPTWVGVSGAGPLNFALANNARADGTFRVDSVIAKMGQGQIDMSDSAQSDLYLHGFRRGFEFLAGHPLEAAALLVRKAALASDAFALGFGASNWPGGLTGTRRPVDVFIPSLEIAKPIALVLLGWGVWASRRNLRRAGIVWMTALFGVAVTLATFGYARFFIQVMPFAYLFQAAGLLALTDRTSAGVRRALAIGVAIVVVILTAELAIGAAHPRNFRATGSTDPATGKLVQDAQIELVPLP